tara:strand:- start:1148 stop:1555 length:408 start_codon:yes stop_codon:yes gene_type:complete
MSKRLYISGDFIEIDKDNGTTLLRFLRTSTTYRTFSNHWLIESDLKGHPDHIITFNESTIYFNEAGAVAFSQSTLQSFLDANTLGGTADLVRTNLSAEPTGSNVVVNMVSLTQAEYDAAETATTLVATTLYVING